MVCAVMFLTLKYTREVAVPRPLTLAKAVTFALQHHPALCAAHAGIVVIGKHFKQSDATLRIANVRYHEEVGTAIGAKSTRITTLLEDTRS